MGLGVARVWEAVWSLLIARWVWFAIAVLERERVYLERYNFFTRIATSRIREATGLSVKVEVLRKLEYIFSIEDIDGRRGFFSKTRGDP